MARRIRDLDIFEISSVDKSANPYARVLIMKRDDEPEEAAMTVMQKFLSNDPSLPEVVANLVAHGAMSGDDVDVLLNKRASERRAPGENFFTSFNKCFATSNPRDPVGRELFGIRMAMTRGRLAKVVPAYVAKSDMKPKPDAGDGEVHLPDDPMAEIEALAAQHRKTPAGQGMTKEKAVAHIITNTDRGRALYQQHKAANLRKAEALHA